MGRRPGATAIALFCAVTAAPAAHAWTPEGHEAIEAAAYRRLIARETVPDRGVSGTEVLRRLIRRGVLEAPPCFEPETGSDLAASCAAARERAPLDWWPVLGSGSQDLLFSRQLGHRGQCFHFMADDPDGEGPPDPELGVARTLAGRAYERCVRTLHALIDELFADPDAARERGRGAYALLHAVADAWSPAHVEREGGVGRIRWLKTWVVRDGISWLWKRTRRKTQHAAIDGRDEAWIRDGRACADHPHPYALPESCLSAPAARAARALEELLILLERVGPDAATGTRRALDDPDAEAAWRGYLAEYFASSTERDRRGTLEPARREWRPNLLFGVRGGAGRDAPEGTVLVAALPHSPESLPFVPAATAAASWRRVAGVERYAFGIDLALLVPISSTIALGTTPAAAELACDENGACAADLHATSIHLWWFLEAGPWLALAGPRWSWVERGWVGPIASLAAGWAFDVDMSGSPPRRRFGDARWVPPSLAEASYRRGVVARALLFESTVLSTAEDHAVGVVFEARWTRDRWDHRTGLSFGVATAITHGRSAGRSFDELVLSPALRYWLAPHVFALTAEPLVGGAGYDRDGKEVVWDLAGRAGVSLMIGQVELALSGPRISYLDEERRSWRPFTARLGWVLK